MEHGRAWPEEAQAMVEPVFVLRLPQTTTHLSHRSRGQKFKSKVSSKSVPPAPQLALSFY